MLSVGRLFKYKDQFPSLLLSYVVYKYKCGQCNSNILVKEWVISPHELLSMVLGHFADRHFADKHFADRTFRRQTFPHRLFANGHFADKTYRRQTIRRLKLFR